MGLVSTWMGNQHDILKTVVDTGKRKKNSQEKEKANHISSVPKNAWMFISSFQALTEGSLLKVDMTII